MTKFIITRAHLLTSPYQGHHSWIVSAGWLMSLKYPNLLIVFQESNLRPHILDFLSTSAVLGQTSLKPLKCQHTSKDCLSV